jgi:hypothetical protein
MRKMMLIPFLVLGAPVLSRSQSTSDLKAKYQALPAYEVRPGIVMMPLFTSDGQVCEIVVERHTMDTPTKTTINLDPFLSKETVKELVDELAPPSVRGKALTGFDAWFGSVTIDGPFVITKYTYENVLVEVHGINRDPGPGGDSVVIIKWRKRTCASEERPIATTQQSKQQSGPEKGDGNLHTDTATKTSSKPNQ